MYKIMFLKTGHVFELPENEASELKKNFPEEYKILEKNGKKFRDKPTKTKTEIDLKNIRDLVIEED